IEMCIKGGRVDMRVASGSYEGTIIFKDDKFYASVDPVYFARNLQRVYAPNAGVGLFGRFQLTGDILILDIDEIGDVLDTSQCRGNAPATWRCYLRRKSWACNLDSTLK